MKCVGDNSLRRRAFGGSRARPGAKYALFLDKLALLGSSNHGNHQLLACASWAGVLAGRLRLKLATVSCVGRPKAMASSIVSARRRAGTSWPSLSPCGMSAGLLLRRPGEQSRSACLPVVQRSRCSWRSRRYVPKIGGGEKWAGVGAAMAGRTARDHHAASYY